MDGFLGTVHTHFVYGSLHVCLTLSVQQKSEIIVLIFDQYMQLREYLVCVKVKIILCKPNNTRKVTVTVAV
jgi:hypothetical protein